MEEQEKVMYGEGQIPISPQPIGRSSLHFVIQEKKLTFPEASKCLCILGKDESGVRYAYLMLSVAEKFLTDIEIISNFKHVLYVDLSGNFLNLEALQPVCKLPYLLYLKAERNKIESAALTPMPYLQVLILSKNQITETCDINQPILETLDLGYNEIYTVQFDRERLENLKELSLHANHLLDTSGMYPLRLENLYLACNKITKIHRDLNTLTNLQVLHLRDNSIRKLNGFSDQLANLTYLNLRNNKINKVRQFRKLSCLPKLDTLIILHNPLYTLKGKKIPQNGTTDRDDTDLDESERQDTERMTTDRESMIGEDEAARQSSDSRIRLELLVLLPNLKRINKNAVLDAERERAIEHKWQLTDSIFEEVSSEDESEVSTTDFTTDFTTDTEVKVTSEVRIVSEYGAE